MVDIPSGSGANKGFWEVQLRDKYGKFVEMGGAVMFEIQLEGVLGKSTGVGYFIGNLDLETARIEVRDNKKIPKGIYLVNRKDITALQAILPEDYVESKKIKMPKPADRKREREILGWYTDNGYWDANKFLREGVPLDTTEDEENLAILLQMIDQSVTTEDMTLYRGRPVKSEERAAALAALKPGDKITDRGIMSTSEDKERAEFYAETPLKDVRERVFFEIDLPAGSKALKIEDTDSSFRGEYEVLLPPNTEFTIQDNVVDDAGVRRIKVKVFTYVDEATTPTEAQKKALEEYASGELALDANTYLRTGESYFYPKEEGEPESVAKIKDKHLEELKQKIEDLSSAFDGAVLAEDMTLYRSLDDPSFGFAYDLELKDGEVLDLSRLEGTIYTDKGFMSTTKDADFSYSSSPIRLKINAKAGQKAIDLLEATQFDALQREQEVLFPAGSKFKISKASYNSDEGKYYIEMDYLDESATDSPEPEFALPPVLQNELNIIKMIQSLGQSPEDLTQGEVDAVEKYRGFKRENQDLFFYEKLNAYLRYKEQRGQDAPDYSTEVANLDSVLEKFEGLPEDTIVYRGVSGRSKRYQNLKVGDEISDAGYTSTSLNEGVAWGFATGDDGADEYLGFLIEIRLPKGTKVIEPIAATEADPEGYFRKRAEESKGRALTSTEREFILPRGSKFKVLERIDEPEDSFETDTPTRFILELVPPTSTESDLDQDSPTIYDEFFDGGMVDLRALRDSESRVSPYDLDMFSSDQVRALEWYGQAGHRSINKILRGGESISTKDQELIDNIDAAIEENGQVFSAARIFRGDTPSQSSNYYKFLEGLTEGKIVNFPGYFSASNDAQIAFSEFGPGQGGSDDDASNSHLSSTFFWSIDIPENGKAMAMPEGLGYGQGAESEVILPRNTQLKIIGLKKVEQLDDEGSPTGNYNYFIHAGQQIGATVSEPEPATQSVVSYPDRDHFDVPALTPKNIDETLALSYYTGETKKYVNGHKIINTYLRTGKHYDGVNSPETQAYVLKQIDALQKLVNSQTIDKNLKTFRYQEEVPEGLKAGDVWSSSGFLSTSTSTTMQGDQIVETEFASLPVQMEVNIPAGFRGGAVDTTLGRDEGEVLLPPGSKFVVQSIEKVDEKTKISLILVEQDEWVEPESSRAATENAKQIALSLDKQYILRFLDRVGPQLGSNDGGTYKDSITGKEYYVKTPKSEEHRRNEMLASALYNLTNIGSAGVRFGSDANGVEKTYSAIIPGKTLAETDITAETKKEIQDGFAIDAWLANWDVAGLEDDNIIINNDGKPYRIDTGGALLFRAQGAPKGEAFGDEVTEIDTLRDPNRNPASAALFGDMTYSDLVASASKLLDVSPEDIDILVDATFDEPLATQLKNKLKARRISILKRFDLLGSIA